MPKTEVSLTSSPSYSGVFTKEIYDIKWPETGTEEEKKKAVIKALDTNKEAALDRAILVRSSKRVEELRNLHDSLRTKNFGSWLRDATSKLPLIGSWKSSVESNSEVSIDTAREELAELVISMSVLKDGLSKESIYDLEKRYVLIKRDILKSFSEKLCSEIEESLLLCREESVPVQLIRKFIDNALNLPILYKQIDLDKAKKIKEQPFMKPYSAGVQEELALMAYQVAVDSHDSNSTTPKRRIFFLTGDPSTGKSYAIREIANYLGLPIHFPVIRTTGELSADKLEGGIRTMMTQNPGLLAEALLQTNKDGSRYLNGFLVLDDFDKVLFKPDGKVDQAALTFLLTYLEADLQKFYNNYFGAHINIRRLNIAISCNRPIPKPDPKVSTENDVLAALRSRVKQVHFPAFSEASIRSILENFIKETAAKYDIEQNEAWDQLIEQAIAHEKKKGTFEPRSLKRRIEDMAGRFKLGLPLIPDETIEFGPKQSSVDELVNMLQKVSIGTDAPLPGELDALPNPNNKKKTIAHQYEMVSTGSSTSVSPQHTKGMRSRKK